MTLTQRNDIRIRMALERASHIKQRIDEAEVTEVLLRVTRRFIENGSPILLLEKKGVFVYKNNIHHDFIVKFKGKEIARIDSRNTFCSIPEVNLKVMFDPVKESININPIRPLLGSNIRFAGQLRRNIIKNTIIIIEAVIFLGLMGIVISTYYGNIPSPFSNIVLWASGVGMFVIVRRRPIFLPIFFIIAGCYVIFCEMLIPSIITGVKEKYLFKSPGGLSIIQIRNNKFLVLNEKNKVIERISKQNPIFDSSKGELFYFNGKDIIFIAPQKIATVKNGIIKIRRQGEILITDNNGKVLQKEHIEGLRKKSCLYKKIRVKN